MNSFSFNRFFKTLCWVLGVNFRKLLMWTVGSVLAVFMGEMVFLKMGGFNDPYSMIRSFAQFGTVLFILISLIMVSSIASSVNEKRKREAFLMLPSTNLEKYFSLMLYTTVICTLCVFLAIALGDSLRMAWFAVSGEYHGTISIAFKQTGETYYWWSSAVPQLLDNLQSSFVVNVSDSDSVNYSTLFRVLQTEVFLGFLFWIHSLYIIGGTFLRKYSFVATSVFFILCMVLLASFMKHYDIMMFRSEWDGDKYIGQEVGAFGYVMAVALPLFSVFNYWASYRIFKGFQLITNKWINYDILKR